jgi:CheY-like chemotaxis protein
MASALLGLFALPEPFIPCGMTQKFHVLHVEDDELDALNVQRLMKQCEAVAHITVARDGVEALDLLRSGRSDLHDLVILLDICMPRMSGLEFLRELRADPELCHLPVVVLSTSDHDKDKEGAYSFNVAGYLIKSAAPERFRRSLAAFASYWSSSELV